MINKILIIDIETTGFNYIYHSIVEIGGCLINLKEKTVLPLFSFITHQKDKYINKNAWIFKNTDLKYYNVINSKNLEYYRTKLQSYLLKYKTTAYNNAFDFKFLEKANFKINKFNFDAMLFLTPILKLKHNVYKHKYPKFQEAYRIFFNSNFIEKHRALNDAYYESKLYLYLLTNKKFKKKILKYLRKENN